MASDTRSHPTHATLSWCHRWLCRCGLLPLWPSWHHLLLAPAPVAQLAPPLALSLAPAPVVATSPGVI